MDTSTDKRIVMTLDAGGTNFVFSAMQSNQEVVEPITLPSNGHNLDKCLRTIIKGFADVKSQLETKPSAISFAFPGPTDYPNGIVGNLNNLPCFRGGVALGPMLSEYFKIPVFMNNDGDLFVYGEAIAGLLPDINKQLEQAGSAKRYANLFGITLGTGFGGGIVRNGELYIGDNAAAGEIWVMRAKKPGRVFAEETISIRAIKRVYAETAGLKFEEAPEPKDIYNIATGQETGNKEAALAAYSALGEAVGDALANAMTLLDGLVVIGGGITGAHSLFMPAIIKEMNGTIETVPGETIERLEFKAYNIEEKNQLAAFIKGQEKEIDIPFTNKKITYDPLKRIGIGISRLGTSSAVSIGAYSFALNELDKMVDS